MRWVREREFAREKVNKCVAKLKNREKAAGADEIVSR